MKLLPIALLLCWHFAARAAGPEYYSSCAWVVEGCLSNDVPANKRIFLATTPGSAPPRVAAIIRYRRSLSIRDLVDLTRFRGTNAGVTVLRSERPTIPVYDELVKPGERPTFKLKPLDMIWVGDPLLPR
jgi:hypothetical protein